MRLPSLKRTIQGVAVGAVDLGFHYIDKQMGYNKPFENVTDIGRTALVLGSVAWFSMKGSETALILYDNALPLLTQSIAYAAGYYANKKLPGAPTADPWNPVQRPSRAIVVPASPAAKPLNIV
ncbi:MAG: hypothetical protein ACP5LW_05795 [Nitrososphaeria archaeon]